MQAADLQIAIGTEGGSQAAVTGTGAGSSATLTALQALVDHLDEQLSSNKRNLTRRFGGSLHVPEERRHMIRKLSRMG